MTTAVRPVRGRARLQAWLQATGFFRGFLLITFMPAALAALAVYEDAGVFSLGRFAAMMLGAWLLHMGTNLMNEAEDARTGVDLDNPVETPFSGGTRVVAQGKLTPAALHRGALAAFGLGGLVFLAFVPVVGWPAFGVAALGGALGYAYTAPPFRLCYRGLGEATVGIVDGPLIGLTVSYTQIGRFSLPALATAVVMGLLAMAVLTMNEFPDYEADRRYGKRNLVARFGLRTGARLHAAWTALAYGALALAAGTGVLPWPTLLGLLGALSFVAVRRLPLTNLADVPSLTRACAGTIRTQVVTWLCMCGGYTIVLATAGGGV